LNAKKKKEALKEREKQKEKDRDDDEEKEKEKDEDIVIQKEVNQELQIIESAGYNSIPKTLELVNKLKEQPDGESLAHSSKLTILMEIVKLCIQRKEKLLIFSQFVLNLNFMEARIAEYNKTTTEKIHHFRLDGTTAQAQRQHMIRAFQKDDSKNVFLISTRAGGLGLNLTAANHVVLFDVNWNPCHDEQALTRVYRYGQQKPVFIYRLQNTSTMEEYIYKNNVKKQGLAKRVVDNIPIRRLYGRSDIDKHYVYEPKQNDEVADPGSDPIMSELLQKFKDSIMNIILHTSQFHKDPLEEISEELRKEALEEEHMEITVPSTDRDDDQSDEDSETIKKQKLPEDSDDDEVIDGENVPNMNLNMLNNEPTDITQAFKIA